MAVNCNNLETAEFAGRLNSSLILSGEECGFAEFTGKFLQCVFIRNMLVDSITILDASDVIFTLSNGDEVNMGRVGNGISMSIKHVYINQDSHLVISQQNGNDIDLGIIHIEKYKEK